MAPFEGDAPQLFAVIVLFLALCLIVVPLRMYVRWKNDAFGQDDYLMAAAAPCFLGLSIICICGSFNGIGVHGSKLDAQQQNAAMLWFFLFSCFWCLTVILVKLSIAFLIIRIADILRGYTYSLYAMCVVVTVTNLIAFFYIIGRCSPVSASWHTSQLLTNCQPADTLTNVYYASTAVNIATDWFCAILPIPLLWDLQLSWKSKLSVTLLLGLGVLASITACVRLRYEVLLETSSDYFYSYGNLMLWGYAEVGIGVFVGCLSTLRPLMSKSPSSTDQRWDTTELTAYEFSSTTQGTARTTLGSDEELVMGNQISVTKELRQSSSHSSCREQASSCPTWDRSSLRNIGEQ